MRDQPQRRDSVRPKVLLVVLVAAAGILSAILGLAKFQRRAPTELNEDNGLVTTSDHKANLAGTPATPVSGLRNGEAVKVSSINAAIAEGMPGEDYVQERVAQLRKLGMNDDPASLATIRAELTNADREIRAAARAAAIQFGDSGLALYLRDLAEVTSDPSEKSEILAAANQLSLPPLGEIDAPQPIRDN